MTSWQVSSRGFLFEGLHALRRQPGLQGGLLRPLLCARPCPKRSSIARASRHTLRMGANHVLDRWGWPRVATA